MVVSVLHMIFEYLALKHDVSWRQLKLGPFCGEKPWVNRGTLLAEDWCGNLEAICIATSNFWWDLLHLGGTWWYGHCQALRYLEPFSFTWKTFSMKQRCECYCFGLLCRQCGSLDLFVPLLQSELIRHRQFVELLANALILDRYPKVWSRDRLDSPHFDAGTDCSGLLEAHPCHRGRWFTDVQGLNSATNLAAPAMIQQYSTWSKCLR